ncbi:MAG: sulfatase-like hydrolase/transferase [Dethiosulfatibacter sp.]|nr:sulfatase-like hydrolase/transferase [Dethiosulfatibacter sp.]
MDDNNRNNKIRSYLNFEGIILVIFLSISLIYMEIILKVKTETLFTGIGFFYSATASIAVSLVFYFVYSFLNGIIRKIFIGSFLFFMAFLFGSQIIYFDIFKTFYTVYSAGRATQVLVFMDDILHFIGANYFWILLLLTPFGAFIFYGFKMRITSSINWLQRAVSLFLLLIIFGIFNLGINVEGKEMLSPYNIFVHSSHPVISVNKLGLVSTMGFDLQRTLIGTDAYPEPVPLETTSPSLNRKGPKKAFISQKPRDQLSANNDLPEFNIMPIDFQSLITETTDQSLINMHQYFSQVQPTEKNTHTGIFEGYNLILITAEAFSHYAVDEELTPTLFKMANEGFNFTNFYNPIWDVSTLDGEYVATTGLIPKSGVWSMYYSSYNEMPYAMGNMLGSIGYKTMAYHNHFFNYYDRQVSHPNLGYIYKGLGNGLDVKPTWPASDLEMMELSADEYMGEEPFHAYYMTVSGHLRYTFAGNYIALKNREEVDHLKFSEGGKAYLATQIELDRALAYLLEKLEQKGIADKTLFVISADHYPYGLDKQDLDELAGHEVESNFELYKSALIIYAKGMKSEIIERPVSSLDIIPTVMNLMGLEYDSRLLMGVDAFSNKEPLVIFLNKSFITDKGRYNSISDQFSPETNMDNVEKYIEKIKQEIDRKFYYSAKILDLDYYSIVLK